MRCAVLVALIVLGAAVEVLGNEGDLLERVHEEDPAYSTNVDGALVYLRESILYSMVNGSSSVMNTTQVESLFDTLHASISNQTLEMSQQIKMLQEKNAAMKKLIEVDANESEEKNRVDYDTGKQEDDETPQDEAKEDVVHLPDDPALLHEDIPFLSDLVYVLSFCALFGALAVFARVPLVVGFILAGIVVGPSGFGLIAKMKRIDTLAAVGAALVLFTQGLEFNADDYKQFKKLSIAGFCAQFASGVLFVMLTSLLLGVEYDTPAETMITSLAMGLCSSSVVSSLSNDFQITRSVFFHTLSAIILFQDLLMGLFLCIPEALSNGIIGIFVVIRQLLYAMLLVSVLTYMSVKVMPMFSSLFLKKDVPQLYLLSSLSLCLGSAFITTRLGLSAEFGAFFAGLILTRTSHHQDTISNIASTKDLFSAILFASVGMLISPLFILNHLTTIIVTYMLLLLIKFAIFFCLLTFFSRDKSTSLLIAACLCQVAEFSMILLGKAYLLDVISRHNYLIHLSVIVLSLILSPLLFKGVISMKGLQVDNYSKVVSLHGRKLSGERASLDSVMNL